MLKQLYCTFLITLAATSLRAATIGQTHTNTIGITLERIEPGEFVMGFGRNPVPDEVLPEEGWTHLRKGHYDEYPNHRVKITSPFHMAVAPVTNAQYEQFDPAHRRFRGEHGFSTEDDDPVTMIAWHDAVAFCNWLSRKEARQYRLPTEAEWAYACRAGTTTHFNTGDTWPSENPAPNAWGLRDMHGLVEQWCTDWYGPYEPSLQIDPTGRADGDFKVTRGGSHSRRPYYLRSANRQAAIPEDRSWLIGFRIVLGPAPTTRPLPPAQPPLHQQNVKTQIPSDIARGPDPDKPHFAFPRRYINIPEGAAAPLFYLHNHNPDIAQCPNGDMLAIHFTCNTEGAREMAYAASRRRYGNDHWDKTSMFWWVPDRKSEYASLWVEDEVIYNFMAVGVASSRPGAIAMRTSRDSGATWSRPRIIFERGENRGVMEAVFRMKSGAIILPADHNMFVSRDNALTWKSHSGTQAPFRMAGIHTPVVEIAGGALMAFGRYEDIEGKMPKSISIDTGHTWSYTASEFPRIGGGQRATMIRLREGPILFASIAKKPMRMTDASGKPNQCRGMFAALSFDEGRTWPIKKLVSDGSGKSVIGRKNKYFEMTNTRAEGGGYLASCQSKDGLIHIVTNRLEYEFNLKWLYPEYSTKN